MPQRKQRAALYVRESDESLINSTTIESAAKAVRAYCQKEGYDLSPEHEYIEAISAYSVPYFQRKELMRMLKNAERNEFDVLVITEVRALSRKGAGEVLIIYEMLQKNNVKLETISEKFSDDPIGEMVLTFKATYARLEREQSFLRMQRGKLDRVAISGSPNAHPHPAYGYSFIDTDKEVKGAYAFNHTVVYVDLETGEEWTPYKAASFIWELLKKRTPFRKICDILNEKKTPPPKKPYKKEPQWIQSTIQMIAKNPIYIGEVYANKYKKVNGVMTKLPREEWILLPNCAPALIDKDTFEQIQQTLLFNKEEAMRNAKYPKDIGLLRNGFIKCGICGRNLVIGWPGKRMKELNITAQYRCTSRSYDTKNFHNCCMHLPKADRLAWEKAVEVLNNPEWVRARVDELREENKPPVDVADIETTIAKIKQSMQNLFKLAEDSMDDETLLNLKERMIELEKQKRVAEGLLYDVADNDEERVEIEEEIVKFENWVERVRPLLTDENYVPTYEEKRLALRIIGIKMVVFPTQGEHPFRHRVYATIPAIMKKLHCEQYGGWITSNIVGPFKGGPGTYGW